MAEGAVPDGMDSIVTEFVVESGENLDLLERELLDLDAHPDAEVVKEIFRTVHTLKGVAGILGFTRLESLAHRGEDVLSKVRDGSLVVTSEMTNTLLAMSDCVREILVAVAASGAENDGDDSALLERLTALLDGPGAPCDEDAAVVPAEEPVPPVEAESVDELPDDDAPKIGEILVEHGMITSEQLERGLAVQESARTQTAAPRGATETTIRVDVGLLDSVMNLVGELVLSRNQIMQYVEGLEDTGFQAASQRLNVITSELQGRVMKTRMQPIDNVWNRYPRVLHDLSLQCGKKAQLIMEGRHTELDKTVLEAIKDPMTHLVRNAIDHGIEAPDDRVAKGKNPEGTIVLRAYHEGGHVIVEISDDGAGVDVAVIRRKAVERGLIATTDEAARRSDRDILQMMFLPGFSTAKKVSNISGRGVGLDVVRTNIEALGGSVDVQTELGEGTTFKVKIPLTLAIIPALIVGSAGQRYAIPQVSLLELVRFEKDDVSSSVELIHGVPVYRLRGRLLPLVFLDEVFGQPRQHAEAINIVVLQADDYQFGLVVDEIDDTIEIVVKPLGKPLKGVNTFAGATIMGDGKVALILDVLGVAQHAHVTGTQPGVHRHEDGSSDDAALAARGIRSSVLLVRLGERRLAMPVDMVARLEEIPHERVEFAGRRPVVQYRGKILPLIFLSDRLGAGNGHLDADQELLQVVVYRDEDRACGLIVDEIFDIVEDAFAVSTNTAEEGIVGSSVIQGRVTDIIDAEALVHDLLPEQVLALH